MDAVLPWDEIEPLLADRVLLRVAVRLLGRSGRREAIPPLFTCLGERSEAVAGAAAAGLLRLAQGELRPDVQSRFELADEAIRARLSALVVKDGAGADPAAKLLELLTTRPAKAVVVPGDPRFGLPRNPRLEAHDFRAIAEHIRRVSGIRLTEDMRASIERRLAERVVALGFGGYSEYQRYLAETGDHAEVERAVELIATNETYFFRDLPQLGAFERDVLPELQKLALPRRQLNVWSAGCSTGEEAYTLAIMLARSRRFFGWNLRVFGNDICRKVVQTARRGVYRGASFRAMPPEYEHYFEKTAEGSAIDPAIRAMCQFARFNLLDSAAAAMFGRVDVIFCRNVLIYFDDDARRRVISMFYERLHPGGYLLLGHSDSLLQFTTAFELAHLSGDLAFRKPLTADHQG
jgi:chemotaxis protein methyltransferase CheR